MSDLDPAVTLPGDPAVPRPDLMSRAAQAVLDTVGPLSRQDRHVVTWPEDEQALYREDWSSFTAREEALSRLLAHKAAEAVLRAAGLAAGSRTAEQLTGCPQDGE